MQLESTSNVKIKIKIRRNPKLEKYTFLKKIKNKQLLFSIIEVFIKFCINIFRKKT